MGSETKYKALGINKITKGIKEAISNKKATKLYDGMGLFLQITAKGNTRWRFKYYFNNKEKLISLGVYPDISLKEARERHLEARTKVANGINPSEERQAAKESNSEENSLKAVAKEWWERNKGKWTESHSNQIYRRLELNIFPWLGDRPVSEITPPELLKHLRRMEDRGAVEMAHRVKGTIGQVMRYAVATGRTDRDITYDLKDALTPHKQKHLASITEPKKIGELLRSIDAYEGHYFTICALRLAPFVFVRPGELRHAEWSEINFETKEWRIPPEKMKVRRMHIVPLSKQAIDILKDIQPLTCRGKYVFPSIKDSTRPMSNNTLTGALRRMGYTKDEMTAHGFRSMASTLLNEQGYNYDHIERQLAHAEGNTVRKAYNYADYLESRTIMMQEWADYLNGLKNTSQKGK